MRYGCPFTAAELVVATWHRWEAFEPSLAQLLPVGLPPLLPWLTRNWHSTECVRASRLEEQAKPSKRLVFGRSFGLGGQVL